VIRAAGLGLLALLAPCLGRRFDPLRGLGVIYAATVAWEPTAALDIGLRLSYLAAGGILATSRATGGLRFCQRRPWAWLGSGLGVTLAAQWFTLPAAAQAFGRISLLAPAANLVAVPLFGSAVWMTVLGLALAPVWLPAGQACGALAWLQFPPAGGGGRLDGGARRGPGTWACRRWRPGSSRPGSCSASPCSGHWPPCGGQGVPAGHCWCSACRRRWACCWWSHPRACPAGGAMSC
jgi:predicted membrane metal-binding protein